MTHMVKKLTLFLAALTLVLSVAAQEPRVSNLKLDIGPSTVSGGESAKGRISLTRDPKDPPQALQFKVDSSHASLIRFPASEVTIPANQNSVQFELATTAVQIPTPVTIAVYLGPAFNTKAQADLVLVPALIKKVTLNKPTMTGTRGTTIDATAELKAPAPAGGIELYLSPLVLSPPVPGKKGADPLLPIGNPRVQAGSRTVTFTIRYNDLVNIFSSFQFNDLNFSPLFESQPRSVELVVALDPQASDPWQPIPDKAVRVKVDLVPLRINSITIQPSTIAAGAEAIGSLTLNAPAGSNEVVVVRSASSSASRVVLLGSSCQTQSATPSVDLQLTAGSTTASFKVCAKPVTAATTTEIVAFMRSGEYRGGFTVQP